MAKFNESILNENTRYKTHRSGIAPVVSKLTVEGKISSRLKPGMSSLSEPNTSKESIWKVEIVANNHK